MPEHELNRYAYRVARMSTVGQRDVGHLLVLTNASWRSRGFWRWRKWNDPELIAELFVLEPGASQPVMASWQGADVAARLREWEEDVFTYQGQSFQLRWLDQSESRAVATAALGVDLARERAARTGQ